MDSDVAPETFQARDEDCPSVMLDGVAVKDAITGAPDGGGGAPGGSEVPPQARMTRHAAMATAKRVVWKRTARRIGRSPDRG